MTDQNKLRRVNAVLIAIAIFLAVLSVGESLFAEPKVFKQKRGVIPYSVKWRMYRAEDAKEGDRIVLPLKLRTKEGRVAIGCTVDHALAYYGGIAFLSKGEMVRVYINERLIYSLENARGNDSPIFGGTVWNFVDLQGKVKVGDRMVIEYEDPVYLAIRSDRAIDHVEGWEKKVGRFLYDFLDPMEHFSVLKIHEIYLASRQDMFGFIFSRESFTLAPGVAMATMGAVIAAFGFLTYRNTKRQGNLKYLGLSILFMGMASIANNGILHLTFYNVVRLDHLYGLSKLLAVLCLGIYLLHTDRIKDRRSMRIQIRIVFGLVLLKLLNAVFEIGTLLDRIIPHQAILIILCVVTLITLILEYEKRKGNGSLVIAFVVLLFFFVLSAVESDRVSSQGAYIESIGSLLFFFIFVLRELRYYSELYEQGRSMEYYRELAGRDALTRIKNRTSFMEDLREYRDRYDMLSVIAFDVDDLKEVNDNLGHAKGDELLQVIAAIIYRNFCDLGECYRMSGDEFICVLRHVTDRMIKERLDHVRTEMSTESRRVRFMVSASYGVSHFDPRFDDRFEHLMRRADEDLYENKQKKKEERDRREKKVAKERVIRPS